MAAANGLVQFRTVSGKPMVASVYFAANGVIGTFLPINFTNVSTSTDPTDFSFMEDVILERVLITTAPATGAIQLVKGGQPTNAVWENAANLTSLSTYQRLDWRLQAGVTHRLRVFNTLPA